MVARALNRNGAKLLLHSCVNNVLQGTKKNMKDRYFKMVLIPLTDNQFPLHLASMKHLFSILTLLFCFNASAQISYSAEKEI
jgi:hypothetical protein